MTYKQRLFPWCIIRHLPNAQNQVVCRLRRRKDAEDHLRVLKQMIPKASFSIIFDPMLDKAEATVKSKQSVEL